MTVVVRFAVEILRGLFTFHRATPFAAVVRGWFLAGPSARDECAVWETRFVPFRDHCAPIISPNFSTSDQVEPRFLTSSPRCLASARASAEK